LPRWRVLLMTGGGRCGPWGGMTAPFPGKRPPARSWPARRTTPVARRNGGGANHSASQQKSGTFTQKNATSKERQAEVMQFNEFEPHELPESDLSQIKAFDQGLTSDPGCRAQPAEFSQPERKFDTEEAGRYDAWVEGMYEAHCKAWAQPGDRCAGGGLYVSRLAGGVGSGAAKQK